MRDPRTGGEGWPGVALVALASVFAVFSVAVTIPLATFWLDEGYYVYTAWRLMGGERLYTDIACVYGPLLFSLYEGIFRLLAGIEFFYVRCAGMLVILAQGVLVYATARAINRNRWPCLLAPLALFGALGMVQGCRLSASTLAGLWSLVALLVHFWDMRSPSARKVALLGAVLGLSFITKHNVAVFDAAVHALCLALRVRMSAPGRRMSMAASRLAVLFGAVVVTVLCGCWLCGSTPARFFRYGLMAQVNPRYVDIMHMPFPPLWLPTAIEVGQFTDTLAFYSPWLLLAVILGEPASFGRLVARDPKLLLVFAVAYAQYAQLFPIGDFSHYTRATIVFSAIFGYAADRAWGLLRGRGPGRYGGVVYSLAVLACLHFHTAPLVGEQKRRLLELRHDGWPRPSALPYSRYLRENETEIRLLPVVRVLRERPEERMLVAGPDNALYVLANKASVVPHYEITPLTIASTEAEDRVVAALEDRDVRLVVNCPDRDLVRATENLPVLWGYVTNHFPVVATVAGYELRVRPPPASP